MIIAHDPALDLTPAVDDAPHGLRRNMVVALLELVDLDDDGVRREPAAALAEIAVIVDRHEGEVRQLLSEELVAVFGSPVAHDDDTLRALRAVGEARGALPERFVLRAAVERLAGEEDAEAQLDGVRTLLAQAAAGDLLLGPEALRVVPAAVDVVPHESGVGYRVLRFDAGAESFARHLDMPIVGRIAELDALDAALGGGGAEPIRASHRPARRAGDRQDSARERVLSQAESRARTLSGRCRAYGDGAGLLPLRDIIEQLEPIDDVLAAEPDAARILLPLRDRVLAEPSDALWAFRRLLEVSAGDRPLVVLLEDLHWAAPDLLDLVEYLLGWATGPLLLLCVARPELLESRPEWRDDAIVLGPISGEEARTLVELLPERAGLPESVVGAAVEMAEGNPLFLEQLVVFAAEDVLDPLPPTLEVSIASRIDRLPAGERAVLERAAVVGRNFWRSTVEAVSPDDERAAIGSALIALARRRLVHAERATVAGEDGFRFHHALIRDAVYAGVPEQSRAELHEAVARVLAERGPERDEAVGYHLEHAAALRAASGEPAAALQREASRRLGAAGIRAMKRVDGRTRSACSRARSPLPTTNSGSSSARSAWRTSSRATRGPIRCSTTLRGEAPPRVTRASSISRGSSWSGRGSLAASSGSTKPTILLERSFAVFTDDDDFARGRAWHCRVVVDAVYRFRYGELDDVITRLQFHYARSGFARGSAPFLRATPHIAVPTPVREGIDRCDALLADAGTPFWQSFILPMLAVLEAMDERLDAARAHLRRGAPGEARVRRGRSARDELGRARRRGRIARR